MPQRRVVLNGTTLYPTEIERSVTKIGDQRRMAAGNLKTYVRAVKREWTLSWSKVHHDTANWLRGMAEFTIPMAFEDETTEEFTVVVQNESHTETLNADSISLQDIFYYDVEITLMEV